jgi:hypothetical protein
VTLAGKQLKAREPEMKTFSAGLELEPSRHGGLFRRHKWGQLVRLNGPATIWLTAAQHRIFIDRRTQRVQSGVGCRIAGQPCEDGFFRRKLVGGTEKSPEKQFLSPLRDLTSR